MKNDNSDKAKVKIYVMGKEYTVPVGLTIMKAMEYIGYRFIRGCGCRGGFCGACSTVYRKDDYKLHMVLACQETIKDSMYLTQIPFIPTGKPAYNLNELSPTVSVISEFYPEINRCVACNTCTKACPQTLEVMDYVQAAIRGDFEEVANLSFDCISCGLCAMRCPMEISPYRIAELARRLRGKYLMPKSEELEQRVKEIEDHKYDDELNSLTKMGKEELKKKYEKRSFEL